MWRYAPTICVFLVSLAFSSAVQSQELRVGYVDMKQILDNAPQVIEGKARLDLEFRNRNDAIEFDDQRLVALQSRLQQADLSTDASLRLEREVRELQRSVNRRKEDLRDELSFRRTEEVQQLEEEINLAVQEIAERNGYDLIISSPVVYASPALDITDQILEQLEIEFTADQQELSRQ